MSRNNNQPTPFWDLGGNTLLEGSVRSYIVKKKALLQARPMTSLAATRRDTLALLLRPRPSRSFWPISSARRGTRARVGVSITCPARLPLPASNIHTRIRRSSARARRQSPGRRQTCSRGNQLGPSPLCIFLLCPMLFTLCTRNHHHAPRSLGVIAASDRDMDSSSPKRVAKQLARSLCREIRNLS